MQQVKSPNAALIGLELIRAEEEERGRGPGEGVEGEGQVFFYQGVWLHFF